MMRLASVVLLAGAWALVGCGDAKRTKPETRRRPAPDVSQGGGVGNRVAPRVARRPPPNRPHRCKGLDDSKLASLSLPDLKRKGADAVVVNPPVGHAGEIGATAVSPDGRLLATGGRDRRALLWDIPSKRLLGELPPHEDGVVALTFSPAGRFVATGTGWEEGGRVRVFSVASRKLLARRGGPDTVVKSVSFEGVDVLRAEWPGKIRVRWSWRGSRRKPGGKPAPVGKPGIAVTTTESGDFELKDRQGKLVWRFVRGKPVVALGFDAAGGGIVTGDGRGEIQVRDAGTGRVKRRMVAPAAVRAMSLAPNGGRVAALLSNGTVAAYDLRTGKRLAHIRRPKAVRGVSLCPDGALLAVVDGGPTVTVIDVATGRTVRRVSTSTPKIIRVAFSLHGRTMAVAGTGDRKPRGWHSRGIGTVHLIDVRSNRVLRTAHVNMVIASELAFVRGGSVVVGGAMSAGLQVVQRAPNLPRRLVGSSDYQEAIASTRAGSVVAVADGTGRITLRGARTWKVKRRLSGAPGGTVGLAFGPRGRFLAALGRDGSVRMIRVR